MYRGLWNFIRKHTDSSHAVSLFLPVMDCGMDIGGSPDRADCMRMYRNRYYGCSCRSVCAGGYAGLILGLFGGCLFS